MHRRKACVGLNLLRRSATTFQETDVSGAYIVDLEPRDDARGFFARLWCEREFAAQGLSTRIAQINTAFNDRKGTLRGLHFQLSPHEEVKVVRCTRGAMFDVVVDLRPGSPTYRKWAGVELTADNRRLLYVPEGCAQGYQTLENETEMYYFTSNAFAPDFARGVRHNDPAFGITWPLPVAALSPQDESWPDFRDS